MDMGKGCIDEVPTWWKKHVLKETAESDIIRPC